MTSKQPHPQRCETCKKYSERTHPIYEGNIIAFCGGERTQVETKAITSNHGCASHSSATKSHYSYGECPPTDRCPEIDCDTCRGSHSSATELEESEQWRRVYENGYTDGQQAEREQVLTDLRKHLNKRANSLERNYPKGNDQRDGAQTRIAEIQQTLLALDAMESLRSGGK